MVSFIDSFTYYMIVIAELGLVVYGTRAISRVRQQPEVVNKTVSELLCVHMWATGLVLLIYAVAVFLSWEKIRDWRLVMFSLSFLITNAFTCEWYFRGIESFRYISLRSLVTRMLGLLSIFLLVKMPSDYYLYYAIIAGSAILNGLLNLYYLTRAVKLRFTNINWRQHIRQARFIYYISLTYSITLLLDNVLLRLVSTAAAVGLYAFSAKVVRLSTAMITDSLLVFFPRIVHSGMLRPDGAGQILRQNLQLLIFFAIPLSARIYLMAEPIVLVMFGMKFYPAIINVKILSLFPCIKAFSLFLGNQVLMAGNREKNYFNALLASGILFIVLTLLFSFYWADTGACIALLLAEAAACLLNVRSVRRLMPLALMHFDAKILMQAIMVSALFFPVVIAVNSWLSEPIWQLIVGVLGCLLLYLLVQFFIVKNEIAVTLFNGLSGLIAHTDVKEKERVPHK